MRILLNHVTGVQHWEDLYYHDNIRHQTFEEAAISHGHLKDNKEWDDISQLQGSVLYLARCESCLGRYLLTVRSPAQRDFGRPEGRALTRLLAQEEAGQGVFVLDNLD